MVGEKVFLEKNWLFKNFGLWPSKPSVAKAIAEGEKALASAEDLRSSVDVWLTGCLSLNLSEQNMSLLPNVHLRLNQLRHQGNMWNSLSREFQTSHFTIFSNLELHQCIFTGVPRSLMYTMFELLLLELTQRLCTHEKRILKARICSDMVKFELIRSYWDLTPYTF